MKNNEKYDVPEPPVVSNQRRELVGWQRAIAELGMSRIERKGQREQKKIVVETEIQMLRDRTREVINAYRVQVTTAREVIIKAAQECVQAAVESADRRIADNKISAMNEAANAYTDFVLNIRKDMPEQVKEALLGDAMSVFSRALENIRTFELDVDGKIERNYPERKSGFKKFVGK